MIWLDLKREPHWLDLGHRVRLHVRPCTTALMMAGRADVQRAGVLAENETQAAGERTAALVKALARLSIQDWEGVGDAEGKPASITPDSVDALMDLWPMAEAFERLYLGPALLLDDEKNALGPAPSGTSAAGRRTATAASLTYGPAPRVSLG